MFNVNSNLRTLENIFTPVKSITIELSFVPTLGRSELVSRTAPGLFHVLVFLPLENQITLFLYLFVRQ